MVQGHGRVRGLHEMLSVYSLNKECIFLLTAPGINECACKRAQKWVSESSEWVNLRVREEEGVAIQRLPW